MQLARFPRLRFAHLPTPLEPLDRLSAALGGPHILVKRDDATGLAFGGNKTRKLEYLCAAALAERADTLITTGGVQSNHVRQTVAAAARFGLACEVLLSRVVPDTGADYEATGNILLDRLLGATVHMLPAEVDRPVAMAERAEVLRQMGRRPYVVPYGGSNAIGALGYVDCAAELERQCDEAGILVDAIVHATGSGGTQAGLSVGFRALNSDIRVIGIDVNGDADHTAEFVRTCAAATAEMLGFDPEPIVSRVRVEPRFAGPGYGIATDGMVEAVRQLAASEGLILDPVYTGKAMAGLIDLVKRGTFSRTDTVVFLHTGGTPALFAYRDCFGTDPSTRAEHPKIS